MLFILLLVPCFYPFVHTFTKIKKQKTPPAPPPVFHSFTALQNSPLTGVVQFVYKPHCREIFTTTNKTNPEAGRKKSAFCYFLCFQEKLFCKKKLYKPSIIKQKTLPF